MKYQFFTRTNIPTRMELEPSLEEVFHTPEKYRKFFKPVLRVEAEDVYPSLSGPLYFLYTTYAVNGMRLTFRRRDGKYELVEYAEDKIYRVVEDLAAYFEDGGCAMEEDEEVVLGDIALEIDNGKPRTGQWLELHTMETDAQGGDDEWGHVVDTFRDSLGSAGRNLDTGEGHFGRKPRWLQSYFLDDEYLESHFVGQLSPFSWGDEFDWIMAYVCVDVENGEEMVHCVWETT